MKLEYSVLLAKLLAVIAVIFVAYPKILDPDSIFTHVKYELPALPAPIYSDKYMATLNEDLLSVTYQYRGGVEHLGYSDSRKLRVKLEEDWRTDLLNVAVHGASKASPAVDKSGAYIGSDSSWFYAYNHDGSLKWKHYVANSAAGIHSTAALDKKYVYFTAYNGVLYKFEKKSGAMIWTIDLGDATGASLVLLNEHIYTAVETSGPPNGYVVKVDRRTGEITWRSPWLGEQAHSTPTIDVERGRIYLGANNKKLFALSLEDGSKIWEVEIGGEIKGTVTLVRDRVIFASWNGLVEARSVEDGTQLWKYDIEDRSQSSATYVPGEDLALIGGNSGRFVALHVQTGAEKWRYETGFNRLRASALVIRNQDRPKQWLAWMPCAADWLCAVNASSGKILKEYELSTHLTGVPAVFGGALYVALDAAGGLVRYR